MSAHPHRFKVGDRVRLKGDHQRRLIVIEYPKEFDKTKYHSAVVDVRNNIESYRQLWLDDDLELEQTPMQQYFEMAKPTLL